MSQEKKNGGLSNDSSRIHILYKQQIQMQAQKDKTLSQYRIHKSKRAAEKLRTDIVELKGTNQEMERKIKYFATLLEQA